MELDFEVDSFGLEFSEFLFEHATRDITVSNATPVNINFFINVHLLT